jgi:transcriptional regulator with XRE-family HTH domain
MPKTKSLTTGQRIRAARLAAGLSQVDLAARLDPPGRQCEISTWESGGYEPSLATLRRLAKGIGCPVAELVGE